MSDKTCKICGSNDTRWIPGLEGKVWVCAFCGVVCRQTGEDEQAYRNGIVKHYSGKDPDKEVALSREVLYGKFLDRARTYVNSGGKLLDVGCGNGKFLDMARSRGWETKGIETAPELVEKARREYHLEVDHAWFEQADLQDESFDVITMWNCLDAMTDPAGALQRAKSALKIGGILFVRTPNAKYHKDMYMLLRSLRSIKMEAVIPRQSYLFHRFTFLPRTVKYMMKENGFTDVEIRNSRTTSGDPYKVSESVALLKAMSYHAAQFVYYMTFRKILLAPSMEVLARRGETCTRPPRAASCCN
jgi:2-polyprenyl-3-methyl-5-hydroxy-6-metoxy-1,4-benzoquinol methylase